MQRISRTALLAVIIGLGSAACGGSTDPSTGAATEPQAAAPANTAVPVTAAVPAAATEVVAVAATAASGGETTPAPAVRETPVVIPPILQIKAPLVGGGEFDFAAYAGKPLAIWFWAPG